MSCWRDRARCRNLPADWWDLGDVDANRLALTLCRLGCPVRAQCAATDLRPAGVVRAGVVWTNTGEPAQICACGRPIARPRLASAQCLTCDPPHNTPMPHGQSGNGRRLGNGKVERHLDTIAALVAEDWTDRAIGLRLGCKASAVRGVRRRHKLTSRGLGRPRRAP